MMKGESIAAYYWNKHEKTKNTYQGHWFNTGDQYVRFDDGTFTYAGRGDDMIKAGGIWVSPVEVENTLMLHPAVLEAGVVGVEDEDALIKPKAFVVFKEGIEVTDALMDEVRMFVKKSIAPYKFPRWMEAIDELPKTPTGKVKRYVLRDMSKK
jgi:benzoate-CoA ligase